MRLVSHPIQHLGLELEAWSKPYTLEFLLDFRIHTHIFYRHRNLGNHRETIITSYRKICMESSHEKLQLGQSSLSSLPLRNVITIQTTYKCTHGFKLYCCYIKMSLYQNSFNIDKERRKPIGNYQLG